ncbi:LphB [Legionella birminghamensis]|uniref:LphB n=1 Tax=Legionella birminghamensis TaxID=28083 RepID=A0A378IIL2_9GAMM|nr:hypothetical protein [Legionella birminghamensis]KTC67751.1 LphB [Legionella birminghamensis]STX32014.1 LphB [Legionella birminghamensis]
MTFNKAIYWALLIAALCYLFIMQLAAIWPFTIDDMYIPLRYARHLAEGNGLLWNLNEPPVEGYSNFSFVLLGAAAIYLGLDPVITLKIAGVLGLLFATLGLYQLSRLLLPKSLALLPGIGMLLYKGEIIWAASGLETSCYQALIIYSLYFLLKGNGYQDYPLSRKEEALPNYFICFAVLMSAASLTRPEAPFLFILFSILILIDNPKPVRFFLSNYSLSVLIYLAVYLPYFYWRWHYFGRLLPNSVYCKGFDAQFTFKQDWMYLKLIWPFLLASLPGIFLSRDKLHLYFWMPSLLYLILLFQSDSVAAFYNRLFLPVLPLLFVLTVKGVHSLLQIYFQGGKSVYPSIFCSAFFALLFIPMNSLSGYRYFSQMPVAGEQLRDRLVYWLDKQAKPGSTVVLGDSGRVPFKSQLSFIDSYCLNNRKMTENKTDLMYQHFCVALFKDKPDIIILTSLNQQGKAIYAPADYCLKQTLTNNRLYEFRDKLTTPESAEVYQYEIYSLKH